MRNSDRRVLIGGALSAAGLAGAGLPGLARAAIPASGALKFNILRDGKPFGSYAVAFATRGDTVVATTDVAMRARIAGMTVFDYRHHCEETWRGDTFLEMKSHSIRDNQRDLEDSVTAVRAPGGVTVTNRKGVVILPISACPLTHWNAAALKGPLFNPQTGFILRMTAAAAGRDTVLTARGARLAAQHWVITGESRIEEWYDDNGVWAGLRGPLPDKSLLEYRRL